MSRRSEICIAQLVAGKPIAFGEQRLNIGEMIGQDLPNSSERCMVEWSAAGFQRHILLISLGRNWTTDISEELVVKPPNRRTSIRRLVVATSSAVLAIGILNQSIKYR